MSVDQSELPPDEPPAELNSEDLENALKGNQDGPAYKRGDVGVHNPKDLLDDREYRLAGAGLMDAANLLDKAVDEGNKVGIGLGAVGVSLETLGLVLDPLGSVLAAGIGWLIEHVTPLRWPLDVLYGDPFGISAAARAIENEKHAMEVMAGQHRAKLATLMNSWRGPAADEFKGHMEAVTEGLGALGKAIEFAAKQMKIAGGIIGAVRGIIRDMIAMFLALVVKGALIAAFLAPISFGASIALFITTTIGGVAALLSKIATALAGLTRTMTASLKNMTNVSKATDNFNNAVSAASKTGGKASGKPTPTQASGGKQGGASPTTPRRADTAPAAVTAPSKPASGGVSPVKPQRADTAPAAVTPPSKPGAGGGTGTGGKVGDKLKEHRFPVVDKMAHQVTRDALEKALKGASPQGKPLPQKEIDAILKKFDDGGKFPTNLIEKKLGESWTRAIEGTVRTTNDPLYGGRGAAGKTINEITKGTGDKGENNESR